MYATFSFSSFISNNLIFLFDIKKIFMTSGFFIALYTGLGIYVSKCENVIDLVD